MFDSAPSNLPVEPGATPKSAPGMPPTPSMASAGPMPKPPLSAGGSSGTGRKEPEDIFSDLDRGGTPVAAAMPEQMIDRPPRSSPLKMILIVLLLLIVLGGVGTAVWYFLIRTPSPSSTVTSLVTTPTVPTTVTAQPEPVVEKPPLPPPADATQGDSVLPQNTGTSSTASSTGATLPSTIPPPEAVNTTSTASTSAPLVPIVLSEGVDSDHDGLTDVEEAAIGTNPHNPDTDGDGFSDGSEIQNGYDPLTPKTQLAQSVSFHETAIGAVWSVLLPTQWNTAVDPATPNDIAIQTQTPTTFQVHIATKPQDQTFGDWLAQNDATLNLSQLTAFTTKAGYTAWRTADRLTAYIIAGNTVLRIRYLPHEATAYDFRALFEHVIQRLHLNLL